MYSARDRVENEDWIEDLESAAHDLDLDDEATSTAIDLFLSAVPEADRSKPAGIAAALYAGSLVAGDGRPQTEVAEAVGVSRLVVQKRWKPLLEEAGFEPPEW